MGTFILNHLTKITKTIDNNVIGVRGTITTISKLLGFDETLKMLGLHFIGLNLDLATLINVNVIKKKGNVYSYLPHDKILFGLPNTSTIGQVMEKQ